MNSGTQHNDIMFSNKTNNLHRSLFVGKVCNLFTSLTLRSMLGCVSA